MQLLTTLTLALCTFTIQADDKAWQEKLETAIPEGIKLLEAKEYVKFLKAFVEPNHLSKLEENGSVEQFAENFGKDKGPQLLKVLQNIKGRSPTLEDDGKKATYEVSVDGVDKKSITFRKHGTTWHIAN
jgi:fibrillarin-like rRNA methylase